MHQNVMFIDDLYATISTANFDNRSFRLNFKLTLAFADANFALDVRRTLEEDFKKSEAVKAAELKGKGFWFRFAVRCARLMTRLSSIRDMRRHFFFRQTHC